MKGKIEVIKEVERLEAERKYLNDFVVKMNLHKSVKEKTLSKIQNFDFAIKSLKWCLDVDSLPF